MGWRKPDFNRVAGLFACTEQAIHSPIIENSVVAAGDKFLRQNGTDAFLRQAGSGYYLRQNQLGALVQVSSNVFMRLGYTSDPLLRQDIAAGVLPRQDLTSESWLFQDVEAGTVTRVDADVAVFIRPDIE